MKMKLFNKEGSKKMLEIEGEVNAWLEQHQDIKIIHIKQSTSGGSLHETKLYISVWYED